MPSVTRGHMAVCALAACCLALGAKWALSPLSPPLPTLNSQCTCTGRPGELTPISLVPGQCCAPHVRMRRTPAYQHIHTNTNTDTARHGVTLTLKMRRAVSLYLIRVRDLPHHVETDRCRSLEETGFWPWNFVPSPRRLFTSRLQFKNWAPPLWKTANNTAFLSERAAGVRAGRETCLPWPWNKIISLPPAHPPFRSSAKRRDTNKYYFPFIFEYLVGNFGNSLETISKQLY